jgi:hypothetical protein
MIPKNATPITGLACAGCLGLMLGVVFGSGGPALALILIAGGGALALGICVWAERQ